MSIHGRHTRSGRAIRTRLGTVLLVVAAALPAVGLLVAAPAAEAAKGTPRVAFCHATSSDKHPYQLITTDAASIIRSGHDHHTGPVYHPALSHWGDVIPAFDYRDKAGNLKHFNGSNASSTWIIANGCSVTPHAVTVPAPVATDQTCTAEGTITITAVTGVDWKVDGVPTAAGTHAAAPGGHTVVATARAGYVITGPSTFELTVNASTGCAEIVVATPQAPVVTPSTKCGVEGSFTIPSTVGVTYFLKGDEIAAGSYSGPMHGTVTAQAKQGYTLVDSTWSAQISLDAAATCPSGTIPSTGGTTTTDPTATTDTTLPRTGTPIAPMTGAAALALLLGTALCVLGSRRPETTL